MKILAATTAGTNITAAYNITTGILSLSGTDTLADYDQVLQSVTYVDTLTGTTNLGDRTLTFAVSDGILASAPVAETVDVVAQAGHSGERSAGPERSSNAPEAARKAPLTRRGLLSA